MRPTVARIAGPFLSLREAVLRVYYAHKLWHMLQRGVEDPRKERRMSRHQVQPRWAVPPTTYVAYARHVHPEADPFCRRGVTGSMNPISGPQCRPEVVGTIRAESHAAALARLAYEPRWAGLLPRGLDLYHSTLINDPDLRKAADLDQRYAREGEQQRAAIYTAAGLPSPQRISHVINHIQEQC